MMVLSADLVPPESAVDGPVCTGKDVGGTKGMATYWKRQGTNRWAGRM